MWDRDRFATLFQPPLLGMIHLWPLPGSPLWGGELAGVEQAALADAAALVCGGVGGLLVENYHDVPFHPDRTPAATVAALAVLVAAVRRAHPEVPVGVNVLRNDADAALGIAAATGASFVRVNVHIGAAVADQGLLAGQAHRTLRRRRELGREEVGVLADLRVKHARPLAERPLLEEARDLRLRGLADGLILTGPATGSPAPGEDLPALREALPGTPLLVGSGVTSENIAAYGDADGYIVGTSLKSEEGPEPRPVSQTRVERLVRALHQAREGKEKA
jgi:membrane complex biogenesis BtpA family protein